jgi:tetratricopeptide (TPR) repeat protein
MNIQSLRHALVVIFSLALVGGLNTSVFAAGSGGGGGIDSGSYSSNGRSLTPPQLSGKAFRAGLKHRDRALKHEAKAAKAKSEKARNKSLAKAQKSYKKAIEKQADAVRIFAENYKAANELGFALRKTGDYRKAIGAYNYALELNPNFHPATEYRGEAFLALGLYDQTKQSYMQLFRNDRTLADQLMTVIDTWVEQKGDGLEPVEADFVYWINERKRLAQITSDLSMNNTRSW